jgi:hypothetical protein
MPPSGLWLPSVHHYPNVFSSSPGIESCLHPQIYQRSGFRSSCHCPDGQSALPLESRSRRLACPLWAITTRPSDAASLTFQELYEAQIDTSANGRLGILLKILIHEDIPRPRPRSSDYLPERTDCRSRTDRLDNTVHPSSSSSRGIPAIKDSFTHVACSSSLPDRHLCPVRTCFRGLFPCTPCIAAVS